jgi:hypothetical protein
MTATELMEKITNLPTRSSMFRLAVSTADYDPGYTAYVDFRGDNNSVCASGSTVEEALQTLLDRVEAECIDPDYYKNRVTELEKRLKSLLTECSNAIFLINGEHYAPDATGDVVDLLRNAIIQAREK